MAKTVITPPGRISMPSVRELWDAREVLYRFGMRDVVLRYRQTAVGIVWVLLQPLVSAGIFAIVFGKVAQLPSDGVNYFMFSYVGMLAWNLFANIIARSTGSVVSSQSMISKVYFPRMLVPMSGILSVLLDFLVAFGLGVALLFVYGINPGWPVLLLPVWVALIVLFATGIGLATSAVMVKYRDIAYIVPWILQTLLFASPVAYAIPTDINETLLTLYNLNPLTWFLELFRFSLLELPAPEPWKIVGAFAVSLLVFAVGAFTFQQFEREFADIV